MDKKQVLSTMLYETFVDATTSGLIRRGIKKGDEGKYNKITRKEGYKRQKEHIKCPECGCLVLRINEDGLCEDCGE